MVSSWCLSKTNVLVWNLDLLLVKCDGLFHLSLSNSCNEVVNHVCNNNESNTWYSRLCHSNLVECCGLLVWVQFRNLLWSRILSVKYICVQSKQPQKPHRAAEVRNLAPLELVHWDLCEINGVLTKGGKKYFMTSIDDSTRYCYVYLLKSKDVAFHFLKV